MVRVERSWIAPWLLWTFWVAVARCVSAGAVREDWYLRESLAAIQDWEQVLARVTPGEASQIPMLPVPGDGQETTWPNPVPALLLPARDGGLTLQVRAEGERFRVSRVSREGRRSSECWPPDATVPAYKHPGGGGCDQWYHSYAREFDRLTSFRPARAPFAVNLDAPADYRRGGNELSFTVRNASGRALTLGVTLVFHGPERSHSCGDLSITVEAERAAPVCLPVQLADPGGGLLVLTIRADAESFWLPILTYVEDVSCVLRSVEQILRDTPHAERARRAAALRQAVESWRPGGRPAGLQWSSLFEQASHLRDELLLSRLAFPSLLFLKRKPFVSEQPFMDAHHLPNRPGGGVYRLEPPCPDGEVRPVVDSLGEGVYRDLCLHWDARTFLFAFGNGSDSWDGGQGTTFTRPTWTGRACSRSAGARRTIASLSTCPAARWLSRPTAGSIS